MERMVEEWTLHWGGLLESCFRSPTRWQGYSRSDHFSLIPFNHHFSNLSIDINTYLPFSFYNPVNESRWQLTMLKKIHSDSIHKYVTSISSTFPLYDGVLLLHKSSFRMSISLVYIWNPNLNDSHVRFSFCLSPMQEWVIQSNIFLPPFLLCLRCICFQVSCSLKKGKEVQGKFYSHRRFLPFFLTSLFSRFSTIVCPLFSFSLFSLSLSLSLSLPLFRRIPLTLFLTFILLFSFSLLPTVKS